MEKGGLEWTGFHGHRREGTIDPEGDVRMSKRKQFSKQFKLQALELFEHSGRQATESPRFRRRLQLLRDWSYETEQTLFPGSPSTCGPDGVRASGRVLVVVGGDRLDRRQVRLHT